MLIFYFHFCDSIGRFQQNYRYDVRITKNSVIFLFNKLFELFGRELGGSFGDENFKTNFFKLYQF